MGELRQLAHALGFSTATKEGKAALVRIIKANPAGPTAVAPKVRAAVGKRQTELALANGRAPKVRSYRPITQGLSGDGASKAACVASLLKEAGWKVMYRAGELRVNAARGEERLLMVWTAKGRHSAVDSSYRASEDGNPKRIINVATGMRLARRQP